MKLDSKYFDCVRVKPDHGKVATEEAPVCQWKGCTAAGVHRAPMGRGREGQYLRLCIDHVREFNASYNYFAGMSNAEVEAYQKDSLTGHRPTWKVGANSWAHGTQDVLVHSGWNRGRFGDPHDFFDWRETRTSETRPDFEAVGAQVAGGLGSQRKPPSVSRSRPGSRSWLSATIPTPTAETKGPKTSCAKSSKLITI